MRALRSDWLRPACFLLLLAALGAPASSSSTATYIGPDGEPLPWSDDREALDFLRRARVVDSRVLTAGTNQARKVALEGDGVRADAVFRTVDKRVDEARVEGRLRLRFHDSYRYESAAYRLDRHLGLELVPPTVLRDLFGTSGSLQLWIEDALSDRERVERQVAPPGLDWYRQRQVMRIFDALIDNFDRNHGNLLLGPSWRLWLIDHTRSFTIELQPGPLDGIIYVPRGLIAKLQALDEDTLERLLEPEVDGPKRRALLKRRDALVAHLERLLRQRGEDAVLFDQIPHSAGPADAPWPPQPSDD